MAATATVRMKRAYEEPADDDGFRVLVDGIWPRGRSHAQLRLDLWARDLAPSGYLRTWYGHDPERWPAFRDRYRTELREATRARILDDLSERARHGPVTVVFGARDAEHSQARVIADELLRRLGA